ncbi:MAG: hypothetical protein FWF22_05270, partial [Treponema sp.]|nr:hypothetical protein [Treponema sp.]
AQNNSGDSGLSINKMYNQWQEEKKKGGSEEPGEPALPEIVEQPKAVTPENQNPAQNQTVEAVLRIFNGTIVNGEQNEH